MFLWYSTLKKHILITYVRRASVNVNNKCASNLIFSQEIHMVWADYDKIFDLDLAMTMKARLGDKTTLYCVKDAGHLIPLEQPFKYNELLKCILERVTKYL
ncbi:putative alpha/Beta hydrolase [Helianthus annuus]|nr:putative alpha/Beta hydrolase [Helianthus annuus]